MSFKRNGDILPNPVHNIACAVRLTGGLDVENFKRAWCQLVQEYEILRSEFRVVEGMPQAIVLPSCSPLFEIASLEDVAGQERQARVLQEMRKQTLRAFELSSAPLLRAFLWRLSASHHVFLVVAHRIVCDQNSLDVLLRQLVQRWGRGQSVEKDSVPMPAVQYSDFVSRQGEISEEHISYWKKKLAGVPLSLDLPTGRPRPREQTFRSASQVLSIGKPLLDELRELAMRNHATLFTTLLAALNVLLSRYSRQDDIVVGTAVSRRENREQENLVGPVENVVALRTDLSGRVKFGELLNKVEEVIKEAFSKPVPFEFLLDQLAVQRDLSRNPVFQVALQYQVAPEPAEVEGLRWEPLQIETGTEALDLTVNVTEYDEKIVAQFSYSADIYEPEAIARMMGHFKVLLEAATDNADMETARMPLLTEPERRQLLVEWNDTDVDYPADTALHKFIEAQVEKTPGSVAVIFESRQLTYRELNDCANQLAHYLQKRGVGPDTLVGVCAERSAELVIALLASMKAGGAYVPLDPEYPKGRLETLLRDANPPVVLTQSHLLERLPKDAEGIFCLDQDWPALSSESTENPQADLHGNNLAYVIYTSGSTGKPKGVPNVHRGIVNRLLWMQDMYQLTSKDRVLQKTPFSFDVSVWEFFWPLLSGATIVVARPGGHRDPAYLVNLIIEQEITTLHFVPSMLSIFLEVAGLERCTGVRQVFASGEALPFELQRRFFERMDAQLHNLYGPTEAAVDVTYWQCMPDSERSIVPIGRPVANTQIYILDPNLQPTPIGVPGELHIGGIQLARGYLNRPELTAEKFISDPFSRGTGRRLYRTGDLARFLPDGNIEYLGRIDFQVKLRGFRIELGEIDSVLGQHPGVTQVVTTFREDSPGNQQLVAYVIPKLKVKNAGPGGHELPNGMRVFYQNRGESDFLYREIFEKETYLKRGIMFKNDACVFDVGANIGLFALYAGERCPKGRIYSFEPLPPIFEKLQANASLCDAQIVVFPFGLSSTEKQADLTYYPGNTIMSGLKTQDDTEEDIEVVKKYMKNQEHSAEEAVMLLKQTDEVLRERMRGDLYSCRLRRLSDVMREEQVERIDLLKIDVERAEWDVLQGIEDDDWRKIAQVVLAVHDRVSRDPGSRLERVMNFLKERGYEVTAEEEGEMRGAGLYNVYATRYSKEQREEMRSRIAAFCEPAEVRISPSLLGTYLQNKLPEFMVPSNFVFLDAFPMTASGKVDRKALPPPPIEHTSSMLTPRNEMESTIASIFARVLRLESVGVTDNFFDLGGHSLLAARLLTQVNGVTGRRIPLSALFRSNTVESFAQLIEQGSQVGSDPVLMEIQHGEGGRLPFFAIVPPGEESLGYAMLARHMGQDQTVYKVQGHAPVLDGSRPHTKEELQFLTEEYVAAMRSVQPHGPYCMGGQCDGTHIAEQIVLSLEAQGEEVGLFAIFDTWVMQHTQIPWLWKVDYYRRRLREMKKMSLKERLVRYKRSAGKRILTATGTKGVRADWREQYWPENFTPPRFRAPIVLFKRPKQQFYYVNDPEMGWGKRSLGGVEIHQIEFHHSQILREPHVRQFGETLATWMTRLSLQIRQPQDATDMQGAFATSTHRL